MSPSGGERPAADDFRTRNDEFFARRKELQQRLTELRARADADGLDMLSEVALRRTEREFEDLTYEIMVANFGLVRRYVAAFISRSGEHGEDFESAGKVGLLRAISTYEPERGPFAGWAFKPIQREVLRAVRDADHPNLNPGDFEKRPAIMAAERAFLEEAGPDARVDHADIARRAGVTETQVRRVLDAPRLDSLNTASGGSAEDDSTWEDRLPDPARAVEDEVLLRFDLHALGSRGMPALDRRERHVLTRRFGLDGEPEESLRAIGERLGLSREGVRQIQQKALAKLIEAIGPPGEPGIVTGRAG